MYTITILILRTIDILIMTSCAGELPRVVSLLNTGSNEQTVAMLKVLKGICTNSELRVNCTFLHLRPSLFFSFIVECVF